MFLFLDKIRQLTEDIDRKVAAVTVQNIDSKETEEKVSAAEKQSRDSQDMETNIRSQEMGNKQPERAADDESQNIAKEHMQNEAAVEPQVLRQSFTDFLC